MRTHPAHRRALRCLAHPLSLAAIAALLINDHVLKPAWPSAVTGKLSDVAGLFFCPFLAACALAWLAPPGRDRTGGSRSLDRVGRLAFGLTAVWFAGIKLEPVVQAATMGLLGFAAVYAPMAAWAVGIVPRYAVAAVLAGGLAVVVTWRARRFGTAPPPPDALDPHAP